MSQVQQVIDEINELEPRTKESIQANLGIYIEETFIFEMRSMALAMNLPDKFVDGIGYRITGPMAFKLFNTWGTAEKPLAKWFNDGTTDHWIAPLGDYPLHWKAGDAESARNASAIFFENAEISEGDDIYSYGHMVSGLPKTEAMERGITRGWERFKALVLNDTKEDVSKEMELIG